MEASTSPLSVGAMATHTHTRSAVIVPLPWHRGTTASPQSLEMLSVRRAVVASAEGAESSASSSVCSPSGGTPYCRTQVQVCGRAPLARPTVLLAMIAPLRSTPGVSPPRGHIEWPRAWKNSFENFNLYPHLFCGSLTLPNTALFNPQKLSKYF